MLPLKHLRKERSCHLRKERSCMFFFKMYAPYAYIIHTLTGACLNNSNNRKKNNNSMFKCGIIPTHFHISQNVETTCTQPGMLTWKHMARDKASYWLYEQEMRNTHIFNIFNVLISVLFIKILLILCFILYCWERYILN